MNTVLLCENSITGILTAIFDAYTRRPMPKNIQINPLLERNLLNNYVQVFNDDAKAQRVYNKLLATIRIAGITTIEQVSLSSSREKANIIYEYIKLAIKYNSDIEERQSEEAVINAQKMASKVGSEAHRMKGFVRFSQVEDLLFAKIEPDHNVIPIISDHFSDRYANEKFIIYDANNRKILIHEKKTSPYYIDLKNNHSLDEMINLLIAQQQNDKIGEMWKTYFKSVNIKERANKKQQSNYLPLRYRKNMLEFE